jgi:phage protein D
MTPEFKILADSQDITAKIRDRLMELRVTDEAGQDSDAVSIRLDDRDNLIALPRKGAELQVYLGYKATGMAFLGRFVVDETQISGPPDTLTIRGRAADLRQGMKSPKTRSWDGVTLGALVKTIASEHGYKAAVAESLAGVSLGHVDQTEESDLHLLTRLAKPRGAIAKPAGGRLLFVPAGQGKSVTGKSLPSVSLTRGDLSRWDVTFPDRGRYSSVTAEWHDVSGTGQPRTVTMGDGNPVYVLRGRFGSASEAAAAAKAKLASLDRGTGTLSATCGGDPRLAAEATLVLSGIRGGANGSWSLTHVTHVYTPGNGYLCELQGEIPKT